MTHWKSPILLEVTDLFSRQVIKHISWKRLHLKYEQFCSTIIHKFSLELLVNLVVHCPHWYLAKHDTTRHQQDHSVVQWQGIKGIIEVKLGALWLAGWLAVWLWSCVWLDNPIYWYSLTLSRSHMTNGAACKPIIPLQKLGKARCCFWPRRAKYQHLMTSNRLTLCECLSFNVLQPPLWWHSTEMTVQQLVTRKRWFTGFTKCHIHSVSRLKTIL